MNKPKIEIKNVKHAEFASQETHCFECTVYVDGKRAFKAHNTGQGGETGFDPIQPNNHHEYSALNELIKETFPPYHFEMSGENHTHPADLEGVINDLLEEHLRFKDFKKMLKKIAFKRKGEKDIYTLPANRKPTAENLKLFKMSPQFKDCILLNEMSEKAAYSLYCHNANST